jgi:hypothetical protein
MHYYVQYLSGAVLPFVLRTLQSALEKKAKACLQTCVDGSSSVGLGLAFGTPDPSLVGSNLVGLWEIERSRYNFAAGWSRARRELGWSHCGALFMSFFRLMFWHLMQPVVYGLVLFHYAPQIDQQQYKLGLVVFVREMSFAVLVLVGLFWRPAFLLVNLDADTHHGRRLRDKVLYILAPEKFLCRAVMGQQAGLFFSLALLPLDLCGLAALGYGVYYDDLPAPLAVGYIATALSFPAFFYGLSKSNELSGLGEATDGAYVVYHDGE